MENADSLASSNLSLSLCSSATSSDRGRRRRRRWSTSWWLQRRRRTIMSLAEGNPRRVRKEEEEEAGTTESNFLSFSPLLLGLPLPLSLSLSLHWSDVGKIETRVVVVFSGTCSGDGDNNMEFPCFAHNTLSLSTQHRMEEDSKVDTYGQEGMMMAGAHVVHCICILLAVCVLYKRIKCFGSSHIVNL